MSLDMNTAEKQRNFDPLPDGSFVKLLLQFKGGGADLPGHNAPNDKGLFKNSRTSDAVMLECEFTVMTAGPFQHRKWSEHWTVAGGAVDDKGNSKGGNMTRQRIRAMIESAAGIRPDDESPEAKAVRVIPDYATLHDCPFYAKVRVEEGEDYQDQATGENKKGFDKNVIDRIVTPDMEEYAPLVAGQPVAPKPSGRGGRAKPAGDAAAGAQTGQPRWKTEAPSQAALPGTADAPATEAAKPVGGPKWLNK